MGPLILLVLVKATRAQHSCYLWGLGAMMVGQWLRLWAAGCLRKGEGLTVSGPFNYMRNPLYVGSFIIGVGQCVMSGVWWALPVFVLLFWVVYYPTILSEEQRLSESLGDPYRVFLKRVPRLVPKWPKARNAGGAFSFRQVMVNREYEAVVANSVFACLLTLDW